MKLFFLLPWFHSVSPFIKDNTHASTLSRFAFNLESGSVCNLAISEHNANPKPAPPAFLVL